MQKFLDGGDLKDEEEEPKKVGFFGKIAMKLKSKAREKKSDPLEKEVDFEFDKDSDEWEFEGGALICEICNE